MAEYEENFAAGPVPSEEPQKRMEDTEVALQKVLHDWVGNINTKPVSIIARLRTVVRLHKLPSNVNHFTLADAVSWTRQGRPWRGLLIAVVALASLLALTGMVAVALLFISSTLNAALASFLVTVSTVGFIMAFFFSSITVFYVGALGFGGLTIGSIAFFSVWPVIILSGWAAIAWIVWQGLRKAFQLGRHLVFLAGSSLSSSPATQELQRVWVTFKSSLPLFKAQKIAMD